MRRLQDNAFRAVPRRGTGRGVQAVRRGDDDGPVRDPAPGRAVDREERSGRDRLQRSNSRAIPLIERRVPGRESDHGKRDRGGDRAADGKATSRRIATLEPALAAERDETHREWIERRQRVEVRAPRRVERPHEALRQIDKEGETGERAHGGALPAALQPERQRECKERHESEQRNREVRPERAEPRRNDRRQVGGAGRHDREEVLVPREEQRAREKVGRSTEGDSAQEPRRADRERDGAARDAGRARGWPHCERQECDAEERALGPGEEQKSDQKATYRAGTQVTRRRACERDEEHRPAEGRDGGRIDRDPRGRECASAEAPRAAATSAARDEAPIDRAAAYATAGTKAATATIAA